MPTHMMHSTLSSLLVTAIDALEVCECDSRYKIDMHRVHSPINDALARQARDAGYKRTPLHALPAYPNATEQCAIGLAGAFLACEHDWPIDKRFTRQSISENEWLSNTVGAINALSRGQVEEAVIEVSLYEEADAIRGELGEIICIRGIRDHRVSPYQDDPSAYKNDLRRLVCELRALERYWADRVPAPCKDSEETTFEKA